MANSHSELRVIIRRGARLPTPFIWEIHRGSDERCLQRSSSRYPTRGSARKAGNDALKRLVLQDDVDGPKTIQPSPAAKAR